MGLFDLFKSPPPTLTPKLTLAVGLLHMINADGLACHRKRVRFEAHF
jgi:hypothetical protein